MPDDNFAPMLDDVPEPDGDTDDSFTDKGEREARLDARDPGAHAEKAGDEAQFHPGERETAREREDRERAARDRKGQERENKEREDG